jgi:hypothetical protein
MLARARRIYQLYRHHGLRGVARSVAIEKSPPGTPAAPGAAGSVWTPYLDWLTFANAGMLTRGNVKSFDHAIRNLPSSAPIVEIGSFCGLSTNIITYFKEKHGAKNRLITCDKWMFEGSAAGQPLGDSQFISHAEYREFVRSSYIRNIQTFSRYDLPYTVEMFSDEFFGAWLVGQTQTDVLGRTVQLGGPISFCYIDGNHSYEFAKRDFENTDRFLEVGGFVLFDDSGDNSKWEVRQVVTEVKATGRYEVVSNNPNYLFRRTA